MTTTQTKGATQTDVDHGGTATETTGQTPDAESVEPDAEPADAVLPLDNVFESLKNSRRRQVIQYLQETDEAASVSELAEHVAAIENDTTVQQLSSQQRKRVYVGLYQCHLPKLDDVDVVTYDADRGTVELGPNAPQLERYLEVAKGTDDADARPWHRYYLGVAGAGAASVVLAAIGFGGSVGPAALAIGLGMAVALAAMAIVQGREVA